MLDMIAQKVIQRYESSTCEQLWEARGKPKTTEQQNMIARAHVPVEIDTEKLRHFRKRQAGLLAEFPIYRLGGSLARIDAAAREMPAADIGMPHEQDRPVAVLDQRANAYRQRKHVKACTVAQPAGHEACAAHARQP
jgi:hypothetical protein